MTKQYLTVQKLSFNIKFYSQDKAHELQNKLSGLYHHRLHAMLQNFFSAAIPEHTLIRKDSLLLDLGALTYQELENELPKRLENALAEQFPSFLSTEAITTLSGNNGFEMLPVPTGYAAFLEYFLTTGTLPWQANQQQITWTLILQELFQQDSSHLGQLLKDLGRPQPARKRLAYQSTAEDFRKIIVALEPVEAPVILHFKENISSIQTEKQLVKSDQAEFAQAISYFILTYLLEERGSEFNEKMFVKSALLQMAAHFNMSYNSLLAVLFQALPATPKITTTKSLAALVQELQTEDLAFDKELRSPAKLNQNEPTRFSQDKLAALHYYLLQGSIPAWSEPYSKTEITAFLTYCLKSAPVTFQELIFTLAPNQAALERITGLLGQQDFEILLQLISSNEKAFIQEHLHLMAQGRNSGWLPNGSPSHSKTYERQIALLYLINNHRLVFNKADFIQFSLQHIAKLSGISPTKIKDGFVKTAQARENAGELSSDYLSVLKNIPATQAPGSTPGNLMLHDLAEAKEPGVVEDNLVDVLHYFLQYGAMPWWGEAYLNQSPENLLKNLYALSTDQALLVLKRAGLQDDTRKRFLWQFSDELVNKVFKLLPAWDRAAAISAIIPELIIAIPEFNSIPQQSLKYSLRQAVWAQYIEHGYKSFNQASFLQNILMYLSHQTMQEPSRTVQLMREAIVRKKRATAPNEILLKLRPLLEAIEIPTFSTEDYSYFQAFQDWLTQQELTQTIKAAPASQKVNTASSSAEPGMFLSNLEQVDKAPTWIRQLLANPPSRIAEQLILLSPAELNAFMQFLAQENNAFDLLMNQLPVSVFPQLLSLLPSGAEALELREAVQASFTHSVPALNLFDSHKNQLFWYLLWQTYKAQNFTAFDQNKFVSSVTRQVALHTGLSPAEIQHLWRENISTGADVTAYQTLTQLAQIIDLTPAEGPAPLSFTVEEIIPENIFYSNLDTFIAAISGTTARTVEERQQQVITLLEYFLTYNRWPEGCPSMRASEQDSLLEAMLLLLYNEDRGSLRRILNSQKHTVIARLHLHHLFLPSHKSGNHRQLSLLLDEYLEQDALKFVKAQTQWEETTREPNLKTVLDKVLKKAEKGETEKLTWLLQSAPLVKYIIRQYDTPLIQSLLGHHPRIKKELNTQITKIRNLLLNLVPATGDKNQFLQQLNEATLFYISGPEPTKTVTAYLKSLFQYLFRSPNTATDFFISWEQKLTTNANLLSAPNQLVQVIKQELQRYAQTQAKHSAIEKEIAAEERQNREIDTAGLQQKIQQELRQEQEAAQPNPKKSVTVPEKGNKFYVNNAGLVLLHPFLSTYFTRLNLVAQGQFINPEAQARAVHLLQYLAYNSTMHPEPELVLNKILCNYPLLDSLPLEIIVAPPEAALTTEMLQVVIQRAGKLSSSSVDGFRVSFLHREGLLTETEETWTLRVDQRGYDLLLQSLPWAFGMIKFPWMSKPLMVEWI